MCDANSVCGVTYTEIDLMEANRNAFVSTVHVADDSEGSNFGAPACGRALSLLESSTRLLDTRAMPTVFVCSDAEHAALVASLQRDSHESQVVIPPLRSDDLARLLGE